MPPSHTVFTRGVSHAENGDFFRLFCQHELQTPAAYHWFGDWFTERQSMPHGNREPMRAKILRFLTPEERLAGLAPEEQIMALSDEVLRGLREEYIQTLPEHVQQTIRKRLGTPR